MSERDILTFSRGILDLKFKMSVLIRIIHIMIKISDKQANKILLLRENEIYKIRLECLYL